MKYFKITVILFVYVTFTSFVHNDQNKLKTGFYFLSETEHGGVLIQDVDSQDIFAINEKENLNVDDFTNARIILRNAQPVNIKFIELKLTKAGSKKWIAIKNKMSTTGESVFFICNDKIYLEKRIGKYTKLKDESIDLPMPPEYLDIVAESIKSDIAIARQHR